MNPFEFYAPTHYVFGKGSYERIGQDASHCGWKKVLLVYGQGSAERSGLLGTVEGLLEDAGVIVTPSNYQSTKLASAMMNALDRREQA